MTREHIHFVTGKLAEHSLRRMLEMLAPQVGFDYSVSVLNITVAALMTPQWIARRLHVPEAADRVVVTGYCEGDLQPVTDAAGIPVERGPRDLRDLPTYFGKQQVAAQDYGQHDIEIIAEINHAPRLTRTAIMRMATSMAADGADWIDVGCEPSHTWGEVGDVVHALREQGYRVSIDSLNPIEIAAAVRAGAELVLSVNSSNRHAAPDWGCTVVVVPDDPQSLDTLDETVAFLDGAGVPMRLDPILEPIGFGFARSLGRYLEVRRRYPSAEMMMGIGNLTELTDADSGPINVMLLGICQELGIRSVLTTQVINWARSCVRECDLARRLVHYAVQHQTLPKHLEPRLVTLRDRRMLEHGPDALEAMAREIRDNSYRVFAERGELHLIGAHVHLHSADPFELFAQLETSSAKPMDAEHAFYLGYEMAKAVTALTLSKDYRQDQALDWGFLTVPEVSHRQKNREPPPTDGGD